MTVELLLAPASLAAVAALAAPQLALDPSRVSRGRVILLAAVAGLSAMLLGPGDAFLWPTLALALGLALICEIDLAEHRIPDSLSLGLLALGLAMAAWPASRLDTTEHLIGAAGGFSILMGLDYLFVRWKGRSGLGMGDAKLLAAGGAWLGWTALPGVLLVASVSTLAAILGSRLVAGLRRQPTSLTEPFAFGPGLALGIWCGWLFGPLVMI